MQLDTRFLLVGRSGLCAVQAAFTNAARRWAADWGVDPTQVGVSATRAWETVPASQGWTGNAEAEGRRVWFAYTEALVSEVEKAVFGSSADGSMVRSGRAILALCGAIQARTELVDAMVRVAVTAGYAAPTSGSGAIPGTVWKRGSGAVLVQVDIGGQQCRVLLDGSAVRALQAPTAALPALKAVDYGAAVADVPVVLQLRIGGARVGLGSLLSVAEGDVIALSAPTDVPASLSIGGGEPVLRAFMGRCGDTMAVELVNT